MGHSFRNYHCQTRLHSYPPDEGKTEAKCDTEPVWSWGYRLPNPQGASGWTFEGSYDTAWDCCQACAPLHTASGTVWAQDSVRDLPAFHCAAVQREYWTCPGSGGVTGMNHGACNHGSAEGYETEQICMDSCTNWLCVREECVELSLSESISEGDGQGQLVGYGSREECEADVHACGRTYIPMWECSRTDYMGMPISPTCGKASSYRWNEEAQAYVGLGDYASPEECAAACLTEPPPPTPPAWSCVEPEPGEGKRCVEVPAGEGVAGETYYQSLETCEDDCKNECALEKTFQIKKGQTYVIEVDTNSVDKFNHKDHWWEIGFYKKTTETETTGGAGGCSCTYYSGVDPTTGLPTGEPGKFECRIAQIDPLTGLPSWPPPPLLGAYDTSEACENDCTGEFHEECASTPVLETETVTYNPAWDISTESVTNCPWARCSIYPADLPLRVTESLDEVIRSLLTSDNSTPYAMAAVMVGGELLYSNYLSAGYVEALSSEPMGRTASIGKAVCGAAIGTLYDKGLLSPTDKLVDLLPEYFYNSSGEKLFIDDRYEQITVEHLASMQGGWNRGIFEPDVLGHSFEGGDDPMFMDFHIASDLSQMFPDEYPSGIELPIKLKHIIQWETQRALDFTPGTGSANAANGEYSNYGFTLLAEIIGKKTGQRYDVYIKNAIFNPLGIRLIQMTGKESAGPNADPNLWPFTSWGFALDPWEGYCNKFGCWNDDNGARFMGETTAPYYTFIPRFGYGDLLSTASDYVKFLTLFENTESSNKILSAATKELMFRRPYGVDEGAYYAYGQIIYGTDDSGIPTAAVPADGSYAEHSGYVSGSTTLFQRHVNTRLTGKFCDLPINIVVFLNKSSGVGVGSGDMANAIENALWNLALEIESEES